MPDNEEYSQKQQPIGQGQQPATPNQELQEVLVEGNLYHDWRVKLQLAPGAKEIGYLYWDTNNKLLAPLAATGGVIFPYTPSINVTYAANYGVTSLAHSNYKIYQYENSSVDNISITCDFTAQDRYEANYVLAVIHFFKSVTKMFYGNDQQPPGGVPPPLCFLTGLGQYQFNNQPLVINNFSYNLPTDVDYIRAGAINSPLFDTPDAGSPAPKSTLKNALSTSFNRLAQGAVKGLGSTASGIFGKLNPGGLLAGPPSLQLNAGFNSLSKTDIEEATYVPTKIQLTIGAYPVVSRYDISNTFNLKDYASGSLKGVW